MNSPWKTLKQAEAAQRRDAAARHVRFDSPHRAPRPILAALPGKRDEPPRS